MFGSSVITTEYSCGADANPLIEKLFGDCVYTHWETVAFCIGLSSVCFWLIAQLPQFISNFIRSAADALSPWFLAQWLAGDSFNFLGCVLTGDQLKTQIITAGYFIFSDIVIIIQYLYYQIRNKIALDGDYSDADESTYKGSKYYDTFKAVRNRDSTLEELLDQSSHTSGDNNQQFKQVVRTFESSDGSCSQQICLPFSTLDSKERNDWMYEHRHRLRRLVHEYGLEYGCETARRLHSLYDSKRKEKLNNNESRSLRRVSENVPVILKKPHYKAVLGIAGLLGLACITNLQAFLSVKHVINVNTGFRLGRRALLAFPGAGMENLALMDGGQPATAYIAGQLLSFSRGAYPWTKIVGHFLGWGSSALYLGSRVSQLVKNKQRRSAEGLSLGMVTCAVLANVTYGTSIIMRGPSWDNLIGKAPWLVGSFGTVFLDFSIFIQAYYYSRGSEKGKLNEVMPLLA